MPEEIIISGTILYGDEPQVIEGYLCIRDSIISEIGTDTNVDARLTGLVAPCFVNAHTHIGDSVLKDPVLSDLDGLVKPPHGLKHRILGSTPDKDLQRAMHHTLEDMVNTGSGTFCDFREGGIKGVSVLQDALAGFPGLTGIIMGRPEQQDAPGTGEIEALLGTINGIGLSGINDIDEDVVRNAVRTAHGRRKMFAIHAGEKDPSDIRAAVELEPDFLVHMTHASGSDIRKLAARDIPVVVCPRSNLITGVGTQDRPPIRKMLDAGLTLAVGTDNVMLNSVNMFSEMEFLSKVYGLDDRQVFKMCTLNGAKIIGLDTDIGSILEGKTAKLMVLDEGSSNLSNSSDMLASFVRRGRPDDIISIIRSTEE